jgi:hypothetical protein
MSGVNPADYLPAALMVESIFHGICLITFFACIQRLLWKKDGWKRVSDINFRLLSVVLVLFVSSSLDQALEFVNTNRTFAQYELKSAQQDQHWMDVLGVSCTWLIRSFLLTRQIYSVHASHSPVSPYGWYHGAAFYALMRDR